MIDEIVINIFNELNSSDLQYIVLRNYEKFPYDVGNDIDLLISAKEHAQVQAVITDSFSKLGFLSKTSSIEKNGMLCKGVKIQSDGSTTSLSIHIQFWVSCEITNLQRSIPGLSYKVFIEKLIKNKELISQNGCHFYVAGAIDRFILLVRQWIFKKKPIYQLQLKDLLNIDSVNDFGQKFEIIDVPSICKNDDITTNYLKKFILMQWGKQGIMENYGHSFKTLLSRKRTLLAPMVYITGPDGAGKTSVSTALSKSLEVLNINYKHVYSVKRNIIRHGIFMLRRKLHGTTDNKFSQDPAARKFRFIMTEDITDRDDDSFLWKLRKLVTLLISITDVFINFIPVTYFRLRYDAVVVETSPYDIFIKYHMPKFNMLEKVFSPLIPKATFGLLLKADAEVIAERKRELYPEEINDYYKRLDVLLERANTSESFFEIRTDTTFEETKESVYQIVATKL
jgi:hypothetical protein